MKTQNVFINCPDRTCLDEMPFIFRFKFAGRIAPCPGVGAPGIGGIFNYQEFKSRLKYLPLAAKYLPLPVKYLPLPPPYEGGGVP